MKKICAVLIAATLLAAPPAKAVDVLTLVPVVMKYLDGLDNRKKAKEIKAQLSATLKKQYEQTHQKSFEELRFLAAWQQVSAQAAGISTIADRLLFLEPMKDLHGKQVSAELFFTVLSVKQANALRAECNNLEKAILDAAPKSSDEAFIAADLRKRAAEVSVACSEIADYRARLKSADPDTKTLISSLPKDAQQNFNAQYSLAFNESWDPGNSVAAMSADPNLELQVRAMAIYADSLFIRQQLLDLKKATDGIQDLTFSYLSSLFMSMKEAQTAFAKMVDPESPQIKMIGDLRYPSTPWTATVRDILQKVAEAESKDDE